MRATESAAGQPAGSPEARRSSGASAFLRVSRSSGELAEHGGQGSTAIGQRLAMNGPPPRRDVHQHRPQVGRVTRAFHQPDLLQPADRHGSGGSAHAFVRGQVGHPDGALIEQGDQDRQLCQRQLTGRRSVGIPAAQDRKELGQRAMQPCASSVTSGAVGPLSSINRESSLTSALLKTLSQPLGQKPPQLLGLRGPEYLLRGPDSTTSP